MNDFDDFQKRQVDIFSEEISIEYVTLMLANRVGRLAQEAAYIVRGDHEGKGAIQYEEVTNMIMGHCGEIVRYVALIATVLEKKFSDVLETRK